MGNFIPKTGFSFENNSDDISELKKIRERTDELENEINKLKSMNEDLIKVNNDLQNEIAINKTNGFTIKNKESLKKFVDEWYDKNSDNIDIGVIELPFGGNIDILPDSVEKHMYVKTLSLLMEILSESKIELMGQQIFLNFKQ